ncbi:hypothetical protein, partial [Acinetobacter baumannii]|uniref:hypothetical protein n=1 Tax=Acinetobacter baumannii TaxID=470 RepID=UPI001BB46F80
EEGECHDGVGGGDFNTCRGDYWVELMGVDCILGVFLVYFEGGVSWVLFLEHNESMYLGWFDTALLGLGAKKEEPC